MSDPDSDGPDTPDEEGHPLFPRAETATGPDLRRFDYIQIRRIGPDGKVEIYPKTFKGSELRTWEQVHEIGGGGTYQLVAQSKKHAYSGWSEKVTLPGSPKKFVDDMPTQTTAHIPSGYYAAPAAPAGGMSEMVAMMRVVMESNAAIQAAVLKVALEKQDSGSGIQAILLKAALEKQDSGLMPMLVKALLDKQQQSPIEAVRDILPLVQSFSGNTAGSSKQFVQGVEFAKEFLRNDEPRETREKRDDFGEIAGILKMFTTLKAGPAASDAKRSPAPKGKPAETPRAGEQAQTATTERMRRPDSPIPPNSPPDTDLPSIGAPSFHSWPWPYMPAHGFGVQANPPSQGWVTSFAPPSIAGAQPAPRPAPKQSAPSGAHLSSVLWRRYARRGGRRIRRVRRDAQNFAVTVPQAVPMPVVEQLPLAEPVASAPPTVENVASEQGTVAEIVAAAPVPMGTPTSTPFDPLAALRPMLAELHAEAQARDVAPTQDQSTTAPVVQRQAAPPVEQDPQTAAFMNAFGVSFDVMQGFSIGAPAGEMFAFLDTLLPKPSAAGSALPNAGEELPDGDEYEQDEGECGEAEGLEDSAPAEEGSAEGISTAITMAAADPEFEAVIPEELRPMLRDFLGKSGGGT